MFVYDFLIWERWLLGLEDTWDRAYRFSLSKNFKNIVEYQIFTETNVRYIIIEQSLFTIS